MSKKLIKPLIYNNRQVSYVAVVVRVCVCACVQMRIDNNEDGEFINMKKKTERKETLCVGIEKKFPKKKTKKRNEKNI